MLEADIHGRFKSRAAVGLSPTGKPGGNYLGNTDRIVYHNITSEYAFEYAVNRPEPGLNSS